MLFWILFKLCERVLIERLTKRRFGVHWVNRELESEAKLKQTEATAS